MMPQTTAASKTTSFIRLPQPSSVAQAIPNTTLLMVNGLLVK
ncbi:hypothetical protein [Psychrobacter sp. I-STPA10]|nr:hypothetical protein [Psychrobacter sp. I-STPA10]